MRDWPAIERNSADTAGGFRHVVNARYHLKGELGRRYGVDKQAHTGTGLCFKNMGAMNGTDVIFGVDATSGDLVVGAL